MDCASSWFSGPSVECQWSKRDLEAVEVCLRPAAILRRTACGVRPAFSAAIMIGAPWASSAQTKCTSLPCMRWKRTQMSAWMYSHVADVERRVGVGKGGGDEQRSWHAARAAERAARAADSRRRRARDRAGA